MGAAFASAGLFTASLPLIASAVDDDLTRGGVPLTPFNGLAFQYRGSSNNGLDASTLNEPSVPYAEFLARMDKGEVEFVEFMAPNGDVSMFHLNQRRERVRRKLLGSVKDIRLKIHMDGLVQLSQSSL